MQVFSYMLSSIELFECFLFTQDENRVIFRKDRLRRDFSRKLFAFLEGQDIDMVVLRIFRSPTVLPIQAWGIATSQTA